MMKKSVNLTLSMDEIKEAILNYLKEKNIYIPEDATLKFGEDVYNAYAIVSYTKDVDLDKTEDKSRASTNACSNENPFNDESFLRKSLIYPGINYFNDGRLYPIGYDGREHPIAEKIVNNYSRR